MKIEGKRADKQKKGKKSQREKAGQAFGFSIRAQLLIGFCVPIMFLVLVGIISYHKASAGLTENYEHSTMNALEMTRNSLDSSFQVVSQDVMELGQGQQSVPIL